ncbi:MAG: SDR family oxidoreductase [Chromatiales bacterium]|jgi:citronellol/citronellal dehydrogenase|nr:SDR family oxidoreductase [Chromatiales bacterium]
MSRPERPDQSRFGFSDEQLLNAPCVFAPDLFKDKVVMVSGAGSGLGKAMAAMFARLGAHLVICGRTVAKLERTAALLEGVGGEIATAEVNIRDPEAVQSTLDKVFEQFGRLDVQVNNAGGQFAQDAIDFSVKGWNAVIDTNLNGTWYMMQAAAQHWRDTGTSGNIVNMAAGVTRGIPQMAHTAAARAGIITLSKSVAVEWAPLGIRVNCLGVGTVESSGFDNYTEDGRRSFYESNPMKQVGDVFDVAHAAVYLAAPSAKFVTGEVVTIDGGNQLWGDFWAAGRPDYFKSG